MKTRDKSKTSTFRDNSSPMNCPKLQKVHIKKYSTVSTKKDQHFDKYYILPSLRYKRKDQNPKINPENYQDETFIYKNMHNCNFWNWVHPLDVFKLRKQKNILSEKVNTEMLQKFKSNLQNKTDKRIPLLVQQLLQGQI